MPLVWALRALGHRARDARLRARPDGALLRARGARRDARSTSTGAARPRRSSCCSSACASASRACVIAGGYSPPFRELTAAEERARDRRDRRLAARRWCGSARASPSRSAGCSACAPACGRRCWSGVGAAFDFHAGLVPQAPRWMQRSGLEWVYRLAREPRRLWRRYARYNPAFVAAFARQYLRTTAAVSSARCGHRAPLTSRFAMAASSSTADVAVVGLGRVGLPLALSLRRPRPARRSAIDNDPARLGAVREGRMPFQETGAQELLERVHARRPRSTLSERVADAAARAPHRDHARHPLVLAHRDRHARHPLRARRPAGGARSPGTR